MFIFPSRSRGLLELKEMGHGVCFFTIMFSPFSYTLSCDDIPWNTHTIEICAVFALYCSNIQFLLLLEHNFRVINELKIQDRNTECENHY